MKFSFRNRLSVILSFTVSAGLVTWLITRMDFTRAIDMLRQAQGHWFVPAVFLAVLIPFCSTCRWVEVVRVHDDLKYPVTLAWRGVMFS